MKECWFCGEEFDEDTVDTIEVPDCDYEERYIERTKWLCPHCKTYTT